MSLAVDASAMKIVADDNMPALEQTFAPHGRLMTLPGRQICRQHLVDADVLLVRSVTRVDRELLTGTSVRFVGSATSGTDHVDVAWLRQQGIAFADAAGCNAMAVVEYVITALAVLGARYEFDWRLGTVGIVGAGNIGGRLARILRACGVECLIHDPLLPANSEFAPWLSPLDKVLGCSVVSLHVPLTDIGSHPTRHMIGREQLRSMPFGSILINAARGGVVDEAALLECLGANHRLMAVIDAWENEPRPNPLLARAADIATPHVAGHTRDAKWRGTSMLLAAFLRHFRLQPKSGRLVSGRGEVLEVDQDNDVQDSLLIRDVLLRACPMLSTDSQMRASLDHPRPDWAFDMLRRGHQRQEFCNYRLRLPASASHLAPLFWALGFEVRHGTF